MAGGSVGDAGCGAGAGGLRDVGGVVLGASGMPVIRLMAAVLGTWAALVVLFVAPSVLPEQWRYYIYSPHERRPVDADDACRALRGLRFHMALDHDRQQVILRSPHGSAGGTESRKRPGRWKQRGRLRRGPNRRRGEAGLLGQHPKRTPAGFGAAHRVATSLTEVGPSCLAVAYSGMVMGLSKRKNDWFVPTVNSM